jgi:lysophospholipase L1-like esterase
LRRLSGGFALSAGSLVVCLLLLETATRAFVPEGLWRFRDGTFDWDVDPELGWVHKPNLDVTSRIVHEPVRFRTNADGLMPHTARHERTGDRVRILVVGDSFAVGRSVPQERIYPAQLELALRERGIEAEVINAGVQGYSTDQALLMLERQAPSYRPDVVLYGSTFNDLGGIGVRAAYGQAKPAFVIEAGGTLRRIPPEPSAETRHPRGGPRTWIQGSALYRLLQPRIQLLRARLESWEQRALIGRAQEVYFDLRALERFDWELYGALVGRMRASAAALGARLFVFAHPEALESWDPWIEIVCDAYDLPREAYRRSAVHDRVAEVVSRSDVEFLPVLERFVEQQELGPFHLLPSDPHLSEAGHRLLAEVLADRLVAAGVGTPQPPEARGPAADGGGDHPGRP